MEIQLCRMCIERTLEISPHMASMRAREYMLRAEVSMDTRRTNGRLSDRKRRGSSDIQWSCMSLTYTGPELHL